MATYYVDPAAAGANNGTSWTDAWTSLQTAADTAVAGDIVYCRGTQTISAKIDFDTNGGTNTGGFIKFIGCNASGNVDGTRFVVDGNNFGGHIFDFADAADILWFENIEVKNTGVGSYNGFNYGTTNAYGQVLINCCANNCGQYGFYGYRAEYSFYIRCVAFSNTSNGYHQCWALLFCASRDNSGSGFYNVGLGFGLISHGNSDDGIYMVAGGRGIYNSVIDGNGDDGIAMSSSTQPYPGGLALGCRITNHSGAGDIGLNCNSEIFITGWNYFEDNDGNNIQNATLHQFIPLEGGTGTSNLEDLANTNEGYVDKTNHDFSTNYVDSGDPDLRRTAITVPWS